MEFIKNQITTEATRLIEELESQHIKPLVVIDCITYNHECYIRDALEGFVMQKTDFPFVAIIHDDASTDGTATIILEYAKKYPNIIKPILETENQYSKKNGSLGQIMRAANKASGAKYIAFCEGDDYWIDPLKLQKQVNVLSENHNYTMCFTAALVEQEKNTKKIKNTFELVENRKYDINECFENWQIPTCSILCRTNILSLKPKDQRFLVGDNVLTTTCFKYGEVFGLSDKTCVYRRTTSGWTSQSLYITKRISIAHTKVLNEHFPEYSSLFKKYILRTYTTATLYSLYHLSKESFYFIKEGYNDYKFEYIENLFKHLIQYIKRKIFRK